MMVDAALDFSRASDRPESCSVVVWKQHIRCRQNQQVRGHQGGGAEALT